MRTFTFINAVGLIISLTGAIIIARYVHQELTVNHYVPELERTYIVLNNGGYEERIGYSHAEARNYNNISNWEDPFSDPDVECFTRFSCEYGGLDVVANGIHYQLETTLADSMFIRMFPRQLIEGSLELKNPADAIITHEMADKIWPGESAIGKTLVQEDKTVTIVGVVDVPDTKYSFAYDLLLRDDFKQNMYIGWSAVRLKEGADCKEYNKRQKPFSESFTDRSKKYIRHFQLFPLSKLYFDSPIKDFAPGGEKFYPMGNKQNIMYLIGGAILLLFVGLFNYINIFSILIVHRRRGIAIRKIFGANTSDVFWMVFAENFILAFISVGCAWAIIGLASPLMTRYYNLTLLASPLFDVCISAAITLLLPLAISISAAVSSHRADFGKDIRKGTSHHLVRRLSLGVQYTFTFFLIVVSSYSVSQLLYMLHADLGYKTENIVWFDMCPAARNLNRGAMTHDEWEQRGELMAAMVEQAEDCMRKIKASPLFECCCYGGETPSLTASKVTIDDWGVELKADNEGAEYQRIAEIKLSPEETEMYGLKLLEGSRPDYDRDCYKAYRMYLSRSAKEKLGINDISKTHIQPLSRLWFGTDENGNYITDNIAYTISGVYDEFCMTHLGVEDIPFFITIRKNQFSESSYFLANYKSDKRDEAMAFLQNLYEEKNGTGSVMPHKFIEDEIEKIYAEDARVARIFTTFALLSILISCLGLFGISLYDVQHRRREIAIRKVNGAKFKDIFRLISRRYLIALGVAVLIGTPLAIYALHYYIQAYAHHVPLTPWYFLGAALLMLCLTLATIWYQVRRATRENPAEVIKSE